MISVSIKGILRDIMKGDCLGFPMQIEKKEPYTKE
jgi:hypothetical protein